MTNTSAPVVTDALIERVGRAMAIADDEDYIESRCEFNHMAKAAILAMQAAQPVADSEVVEVLRDALDQIWSFTLNGDAFATTVNGVAADALDRAAALLAKLEAK